MSEDDFHEIQLNGKQLVFLFMSATVVAVVIFLCGVMVGRGVRTPQTAAAVEAPAESTADPTADAQPAPDPAPATTNDGTPPAAGETLTYPQILDGPTPPRDTLKDSSASSKATAAAVPESKAPPSSKPAPKVAEPVKAAPPVAANTSTTKPSSTPAPPTATKPTPATATTAAAPVASEPKGNGFVVQVAATRDRAEAETIARRLSAKGYPTFVTSGGASVFRVRVGKYADRRAAENVADKLHKQEQFKPWITR